MIQNLKINTLGVSSFATVVPEQGDIVDFSNPVPFTVTAEDGTVQVYTVIEPPRVLMRRVGLS